MNREKHKSRSEAIRVLVIEDKQDDRDLLREELNHVSSRLDMRFEVKYWGESLGERFVVDEVRAHIESRQNDYEAILLDHAWSLAEESRLKNQINRPYEDFRAMSDEEAASSVRLLRRLYTKNRIPIVAWTWFDYFGVSRYVERDLGVECALSKKLANYDSLAETILGIYHRRLRLSALNVERIVGLSRSTDELRESIRIAAMSMRGNILILGEAGVGKEMVAQIVGQALSIDQPCIAVNIGAVPPSLMESTLFGHKKGAFTSATGESLGLIGDAEGGCLILDEIGDLPLDLQGKLNRMLNEGEYQRVGESKTRKVDARIISMTNRDLDSAIKTGTFRQDLLQRLRDITIRVPTLAERVDDIPALADLFLGYAAQSEKRPYLRFGPGAVDYLQGLNWSDGHVRSLRQVILRAVQAARGSFIAASDLSAAKQMLPENTTGEDIADDTDVSDLKGAFEARVQLVKHWRSEVAQKAIAECGGDRRAAARKLGVTVEDLYEYVGRKRQRST